MRKVYSAVTCAFSALLHDKGPVVATQVCVVGGSMGFASAFQLPVIISSMSILAAKDSY